MRISSASLDPEYQIWCGYIVRLCVLDSNKFQTSLENLNWKKKMKTTTKSSSVVAIPTPGNYNDIAIATLTLL